jgi:flagellar basal-body rod modification protein FlgD
MTTSSTTVQFPNPNYTPSTSSTGTTSASTTSGGVSLGGTDFLTLMLAQLQNQDPTSPIDSNTFLTQLAQLSEVQGITQLNTSFGSTLSANQTMQASSLLGKDVLATSGSATTTTAGDTVSGAVVVPQTSTDVQLNILNSAGTVVKTLDLGAQSAGSAAFTWDGTENGGSKAPAGTYTLSATVNGVASGTNIVTQVAGTVDSVTMASGTSGLTLNVAGIGSVAFSNVVAIAD